MENQPYINREVLKQTFAHLESLGGGNNESDQERIQKIIQMLEGKLEPGVIRRGYALLQAAYAILPGRNVARLEERVKVYFGPEAEALAPQILSMAIFGTENALDEGAEGDLLSQQIRLNHGLGEETSDGDEVEGGVGKFGFSPTNPIPVNGIDNINNYFDKLKRVTGESISYKRLGSQASENLPFPVDEYQIYDSAGDPFAILYIYAYHGINSNKVPEGFAFLAS